MDTLETFQTEIQRMIDKYSLNVTISGVAELVTEKKQHLYSASLIVVGTEGQIPVPSEEGVATEKAHFQRFVCEGFRLKTLQYLRALFGDQKLLRWQVQYAVECVVMPEMA